MEWGSILRSSLVPGQLVSFTFDKEVLKDIEFSTAPKRGDRYALFETVRLTSWPGWNDFHGRMIRVAEGDSAIIVRKLGRPYQISNHPAWAIYDVYEIMINNELYHAFRCNLLPLLPILNLTEQHNS